MAKKYSKKHRKHKHKLNRKNLFGIGYEGQTSFPNAKAAPYFGYEEPFINASEWWYPVSNDMYQSPQMLKDFSSFGRMKKLKGYIKDIKYSMRGHKKTANPYLLQNATGSYKDYLKELKESDRKYKIKSDATDFFKGHKAYLKFGKKHRKCHKKSKKCYKK
jgi:hypothetical protein